MNTFTIFGLYKEVWQSFKKHAWFLVTSTFIYFVLDSILSKQGRGPGSFILNIGALVVSLMFSIGLYKIGLKIYSGGMPDYADFNTTSQTFFRILWASIQTGFFVFVGLLLFFIPGLVLIVRLSMTVYIILDKNMPAFEAIQESWKITKGYGFKIFGVMVLGVVLFFVSLIPLGLGIIVSIPYLYLLGAYIYKKITANTSDAPQELERVIEVK